MKNDSNLMVLPVYSVKVSMRLQLILFLLASLLAFEGCNTNRGQKTEWIPTLEEVTDVLMDSTATVGEFNRIMIPYSRQLLKESADSSDLRTRLRAQTLAAILTQGIEERLQVESDFFKNSINPKILEALGRAQDQWLFYNINPDNRYLLGERIFTPRNEFGEKADLPNDYFRFDIRFPSLGHRDFEVYIYFPDAVRGGISIGFMNLFSNSNNNVFEYPDEKITPYSDMYLDDSSHIIIRLDQDFLEAMLEYDTMIISYFLEADFSSNYNGYDDFMVSLGGFQKRFYETIPIYQKLMEEEGASIIIDESLYKEKNEK